MQRSMGDFATANGLAIVLVAFVAAGCTGTLRSPSLPSEKPGRARQEHVPADGLRPEHRRRDAPAEREHHSDDTWRAGYGRPGDPDPPTGRKDESDRLAALGLANDDTIITQSARTVDFNGQSIVPRYQFIEKQRGDRRLQVHIATTRAVFGLTKDLTLALTVPYVFKKLRLRDAMTGERTTLSASGLGDATLLGKYRFFQETGPGETTEAAGLFGLKLPTGETDARDEGERLPQPLQPGTGSVDPILGAAFTRVDGRWLLNADLIGKFNSEADDYRFGNTYRFDVGGQFRVFPARYTRFDQTTWNAVAELNAIYSEQDKFAGETLRDTGGFRLFATPGLQVILTQNVLVEVAVQIPAIQNVHGDGLRDDISVVWGLRVRF